jgi:hypothetical protein
MGTKVTSAPPRNAQPPVGTKVTGPPPGVRPKPPVVAPPTSAKPSVGTPPGVRPKGAVPPPPPPPPPPIPPKKSKFEDKESVTEAGTPIDFKWPKGNTSKEIEKLEAEYKKLIEKGSDILEKQKQLIRKEPLTGEYPWENYDKWPTKLKIEVAKLEKEFEKNHAITTEMGKKLFKLKGFNR